MKTFARALILITIMTTLSLIVACGTKNNPAPSNTNEVKATPSPNLTLSKDLKVSLAELPQLAESPDKGYFVELIKALDEVYTDGKITIELYPLARIRSNVINETADFCFPCTRTQYSVVTDTKFRYSTKGVGIAPYVIYSNIEKKVTKQDLDNALSKGGEFPYRLESVKSFNQDFKYPFVITNNIEESFKKLVAGRIDALIWPQEECDKFIKDNKLKTVYRSHFYDLEAVFGIANNEKGNKVDKILSECMAKIEASGKLKEIYSKAHLPYENWQPAQMGW